MPSRNSPPTLPRLCIVPDTGFYIAAVLKNGFARSYLIGRGAKFLTYELYSSQAILLELQDKLENKFELSRPDVVKIIRDMRKVLNIVDPQQKLDVVRDPSDNKILECAVEARADVIVAFDKDLLSLKEYEGIKIVHPTMLKYLLPLKD